jgi:hypothetical protein
LPPPQESLHRNKDTGGTHIVMPPHPRATAALPASHAPRCGSSFSSPPRYSCCAEPLQSATWLMINAAGYGAKSSPFGGALAGVAWDLGAHRVVGSPGGRRQAVQSGTGAGAQILQRGHRRHRARRNMPASPPAGRWESRTRTCKAWLGNRWRLAGVIRAVVASPPPQAHCLG